MSKKAKKIASVVLGTALMGATMVGCASGKSNCSGKAGCPSVDKKDMKKAGCGSSCGSSQSQ